MKPTEIQQGVCYTDSTSGVCFIPNSILHETRGLEKDNTTQIIGAFLYDDTFSPNGRTLLYSSLDTIELSSKEDADRLNRNINLYKDKEEYIEEPSGIKRIKPVKAIY